MTLNYESALAIYEPTLGLEVHVELNTKSKMFCGCATEFGAQPNTQTCPVCLGLPGSLPVVNKRAIESTILIGLALNCSIAPFSRFARKNYFYPDMPKNFQTSQYDEPICVNGYLDVDVETDEGNKTFRVEIERVHMEEDTGKSLHVGGTTGRIHGADHSLLDYNRAGIPLVEIVTKIVPNTGKYAPLVARAYVATLRDILRALKVSDVKMEQGSLRCDVNLSLSKMGSGKLGTRSETKNVNSLRSVERAVTGEIIRHANRLESGEKIVQETRHFLEESGETRPGRSKEQAEDYRYFPEPDLVPVVPDAKWIEKLRTLLPEKPADRRKRLQTAWAVIDGVPEQEPDGNTLDMNLNSRILDPITTVDGPDVVEAIGTNPVSQSERAAGRVEKRGSAIQENLTTSVGGTESSSLMTRSTTRKLTEDPMTGRPMDVTVKSRLVSRAHGEEVFTTVVNAFKSDKDLK